MEVKVPVVSASPVIQRTLVPVSVATPVVQHTLVPTKLFYRTTKYCMKRCAEEKPLIEIASKRLKCSEEKDTLVLYRNEVNETKCNIIKTENEPSWKSYVQTILRHYQNSFKNQIFTVRMGDAYIHEVAFPMGAEYVPLVEWSGIATREYPFVLDTLQKDIYSCVENNRSVLISSHVSAEKTVAAEYSIAKALRENQRVIYTAPTKALSVQKYREYQEKFENVGLITGDNTIKQEAGCLIMTIEVLRNMLYTQSPIIREVQWVIFDEIHYMRDKERGVVWEETIILLPNKIRFVFLAPQIPNARQFAEWVAFIHRFPCHLIYTKYRPLPLRHYLIPAGGTEMRLVVDEHNNFCEQSFNQAMTNLPKANVHMCRHKREQKFQANIANCFNIVKNLMELRMDPIIVYSFSKKECQAYARQTSTLDFSTSGEKREIETIVNAELIGLSADDRKLLQVKNTRLLLRRGIGIHHGGLLPVLKKTVETLFAANLLRVLFATEAFSVDPDTPARSVLLTSYRKFDGKKDRFMTSGEYIQLCEQAGLRVFGELGDVFLMIDEQVSPEMLRCIMQGEANPVNSAFRLTYNMILNFMRMEDVSPELMLQKSFARFQNRTAISILCDQLRNLQSQFDTAKMNHGTSQPQLVQEIENKIVEFNRLCRIDLFVELQKHKNVLKKMHYCSPTGVLSMKGWVACNFRSGNELLLTELIRHKVFEELTMPEIVSFLSCVVCDVNSNTRIQMAKELHGLRCEMKRLAHRIMSVSKECHIDVDNRAIKLKPYLMDVCYAWCNGSTFLEACRKTDIFEGSIISSFKRIRTILKPLMRATRHIGDFELEKKFYEAIQALKRGIAFAGGLNL